MVSWINMKSPARKSGAFFMAGNPRAGGHRKFCCEAIIADIAFHAFGDP
jgi:hypothetical protein